MRFKDLTQCYGNEESVIQEKDSIEGTEKKHKIAPCKYSKAICQRD